MEQPQPTAIAQAVADVINLDALDTVRGSDLGFELELRTPAGDVLPGRIKVRGIDSPIYEDIALAQRRRIMQKTAAGQMPDMDQVEADALELAGALVMGWTCPFTIKGEPLPYTPDNAKKLLQRFTWIRDQVERAARNRANFLPGSASA